VVEKHGEKNGKYRLMINGADMHRGERVENALAG
jgi:hypothetical protein